MATEIKLFADYHTHTIYSHGKGTVEENVQAGVSKGLKEIAITDHGLSSIGFGVKNKTVFEGIIKEVRLEQQKHQQSRLLVGVEANVLGEDGRIDVPKAIIEQLDIVLLGLHPYVHTSTLKGALYLNLAHPLRNILGRNIAAKIANFNTKALVEAISKNEIDIITHPGLRLNVDLEELAGACVKNDVALEINARRGAENRYLIECTKKSGVKYAINSDAHKPEKVGELKDGILIAQKCALTAEQIINAYN